MSNKKKERIKVAGGNSSASQSGTKQAFLLLCGIVLLTGIVYFPSLKNGFTNWDDNVYVAENPLITKLSAENVKKIFSTESTVSNNYHPVTILSLAIDYKLSGFNPKTYHNTNLLFHLLNVVLVFWFIYLLSGRKVLVAGIVALFFGIHPMHVESVAWISERKDVLYTFFFMSALVCYYKYLNNTGNKRWLLYLAVLLLFVVSVLSKAMAVVLPLVLLLVDYYTGRKFDKYVWLEKVPFFILSFVFGMLASRVQAGAIADIDTFTWLQRLSFASYGLVNYIVKLFLPLNLSCFYPYPNLIDGHLPVIFYIVPFIAAGLLIGCLLMVKRSRVLVFGFLFYCVTVALVLQFISVGQVIMADRYSYVPYIGLLFPVAMGFNWLCEQTETRFGLWKKLCGGLIIVFAVLSCWLSAEQIKVWKNSDTLWTNAIRNHPSSEAFRNRGSYLVNKVGYDKGQKRVAENEYDRALQDFNVSIKMNPNNAKVYINRANIYGLKKQFDLALNDYSKAIELDKTDPQTFFNRGITYSFMRQFDKAAEDYSTVLAMQPGFKAAKQNRAYVYADKGDYEKAIVELNELIQAEPTNPVYYFYRGFSNYKLNNLLAALEDNTLAIKYNPSYDAAYFNRAVINEALKHYPDALNDALKAQSLGYKVNPGYIENLQRQR
jgi:tetratricopeptide (TPR) repeat protein